MKSLKITVLSTSFFLCLWGNANVFAQSMSHAQLDANNISVRINLLGDHFWDWVAESQCEMPKGTNKSTLGAAALWIGGLENGNLKEAAMTYRQNGYDFFPGPLDVATGNTNSTQMSQYDHMWMMTSAEIKDFKVNGTISSNIANWPAMGNTPYKDANLAPFVDVNKDGKYNPKDGDYPDIKGDQAVWWVFNDNGGTHGETGADPLGIEVHAMAYEYVSSDTAINNTVFIDYDFINRSGNTIDSTYIGIWTDLDIGYAFDDYIGCLRKQNAYFAYNASDSDRIYGKNPPVESVTFFGDTISAFVSYNNDYSATGNMESPADYYSYMKGRWTNGDCIKYGGDGYNSSGPCTPYMFIGDPLSTNGTTDWTERTAGNNPGDRRGVGSIGPFTIKPGADKKVTVAWIFTYRENADVDANLKAMKRDVASVREAYHTISGTKDESAVQTTLNIFPNPANTSLYIQWSGPEINTILLIDALGRVVSTEGVNSNTQTLSVDLSSYKPGVYTVICKSTSGSSTASFVKL